MDKNNEKNIHNSGNEAPKNSNPSNNPRQPQLQQY